MPRGQGNAHTRGLGLGRKIKRKFRPMSTSPVLVPEWKVVSFSEIKKKIRKETDLVRKQVIQFKKTWGIQRKISSALLDTWSSGEAHVLARCPPALPRWAVISTTVSSSLIAHSPAFIISLALTSRSAKHSTYLALENSVESRQVFHGLRPSWIHSWCSTAPPFLFC